MQGIGKRLEVDGIASLATVLALGAISWGGPKHLTEPVLVVASTAEELGAGCALMAYDSSLTNSEVIDRFAHCPTAIFAVESPRSILVETANHVVMYDFDSGSQKPTELPLPSMDAAHYDEAKTGEAYVDEQLLRDGARLEILALGDFGDRIGAILGLRLPGDDTLAIGIEWNGLDWAYVGSKHCSRFEIPCDIDGLEYRRNELKYPRPSHDVWTIDSASNPNLTSVNSSKRVDELGAEIAQAELAVHVGGVESTVVATGNVYQDGPGIGTSTVRIVVEEKAVRPADVATCGASIYSTFVLTDGCGSDTGSLYSLESGEEVLTGLAFAVWFP